MTPTEEKRTYDSLDIFRLLILLRSESPLGRKRISETLGIGEGHARTLLRFLYKGNYINIQKRGVSLTSKGSELLKEVRVQRIVIDLQGLAVDVYNVAVLVKSSRKMVKNGVEQRDESIKAGATGATTLICHQGKLMLPVYPTPQPINEKITDYFRGIFDVEDNDVIIIGSGPSFPLAERGALAAALTLLPKIQKV